MTQQEWFTAIAEASIAEELNHQKYLKLPYDEHYESVCRDYLLSSCLLSRNTHDLVKSYLQHIQDVSQCENAVTIDSTTTGTTISHTNDVADLLDVIDPTTTEQSGFLHDAVIACVDGGLEGNFQEHHLATQTCLDSRNVGDIL